MICWHSRLSKCWLKSDTLKSWPSPDSLTVTMLLKQIFSYYLQKIGLDCCCISLGLLKNPLTSLVQNNESKMDSLVLWYNTSECQALILTQWRPIMDPNRNRNWPYNHGWQLYPLRVEAWPTDFQLVEYFLISKFLAKCYSR